MSGACVCGFASRALSQDNNSNTETASAEQDKKMALVQNWIQLLLQTASKEQNDECLRQIIRNAAGAHYRDLHMDDLLAEYEGNMEKFIVFLQENWGWKVHYTRDNVLIADENKDYCVCPVLKHNKDVDTSALCFCSEGFAEAMFSKVAKRSVHARIISSVRRGDKTCKYEVTFV